MWEPVIRLTSLPPPHPTSVYNLYSCPPFTHSQQLTINSISSWMRTFTGNQVPLKLKYTINWHQRTTEKSQESKLSMQRANGVCNPCKVNPFIGFWITSDLDSLVPWAKDRGACPTNLSSLLLWSRCTPRLRVRSESNCWKRQPSWASSLIQMWSNSMD